MTVNSRYRYENQNSVYYLKPGTSSIYMLDFKLKGFCKEQLTSKRGQSLVPYDFASSQTTDANIYVIGGYSKSAS